MRSLRPAVLASAVLSAALIPSPVSAGGFSDVPSGHWASRAINSVAQDRAWMRDFGTNEFRPSVRLRRKHLARALVRAFAPRAQEDPDVRFRDLSPDNRFFRFANVAVSRRWIGAGKRFRPNGWVRKFQLDRGLVRAMGLRREAAGLNRIRTADGVRLARPKGFGEMVVAQELGLHYNHGTSSEGRELLPHTFVRRADGAYSLWEAATVQSWERDALAGFRTITLPALTRPQRKALEYGLRYAGYPYVWAGEWHTRTPSGYCCGAQAQGGFDCSGYAWWVLARPTSGWDNTRFRPYRGWSLPERSSSAMAKAAPRRIRFGNLRPMDILFFDTDGSAPGWRGVNHAGLYLGRGWMIHSTPSRAGVSITKVGASWWRDRYVWGRRVIGT